MGLIIFFGIHLLPTQVALHDGLRARFGGTTYRLVFAVVSFIGLALIIYGYGKVQGLPAKNPVLWYPPVWTRHLLLALMLPALILLFASLLPSRIRDAVGHPMLLAVKIWATGHLLANGTAAAMLLFGAFLAWAVFDLISVKRRAAKGPLGDRRGTVQGDIAAIALGSAFYVFMVLWGHLHLIGVSVLSISFAP